MIDYNWCKFSKNGTKQEEKPLKSDKTIQNTLISEKKSQKKPLKAKTQLKAKTPLKKSAKPINKKSKNKEEVTTDTYYKVLTRDVKCRLYNDNCKGKLELHHIIYKSQDKTKINDVSNCIMLCLAHHQLVHSNKKKYMPILKEMLK